MKFTEQELKNYALPLSNTENEKCLRAISMVRDALKELGFNDTGKSISPLVAETYSYALEMNHSTLNRKIKIFIQGSYANNTNVRTQSDVDIAVVQEEVFQTEYRTSGLYPQTDADYRFSTVPPAEKSFKDEVQYCLTQKFGRDVERRDKSIKVHGNTYRKDADTVPCRRYRDYRQDYRRDESNYIGGIVIHSDSGETIINYPEQHIANGKKKNTDTNHWYKKMVRIMKKIRHIMSDAGMTCADNVSSFGLESLLWNVPNGEFLMYTSYGFAFEHILQYLYKHQSDLFTYKEANGIKPLCPNYSDIASYSTFITTLCQIFEYSGF